MLKTKMLLAASAIVMAQAASAAPTVYTSATTFDAAAPAAATETFDTTPISSIPTVTPAFTVSGGVGANAIVNPAGYGTGRSLQFSTSTQAGGDLVFTFTSAINAFGFDAYDLGTLGATTLTATYAGGVATLASNYTGASGNRIFVGFTDTNPFTSLTLKNMVSGDFIEIDNVRTGLAGMTAAVPEASTWALMMVGLGVVGGSLRRRQKVGTRVSFA